MSATILPCRKQAPLSEGQLQRGLLGLVKPDKLPRGTIFPAFTVDAAAHVLACSDTARRRLAEEALARFASGRTILSRAVTQAIRDAIVSLTGTPSLTRKVVALHKDRQDKAPGCWLVIERDTDSGESGCFEVSIRDLSRFGPHDEGVLIHSLGFTPNEAALTLSLARGTTIRDHAQRTGRQIATVRWHLSNALTKARCRTQFDLVRLVLLLSL